jgi:hypothetical protein
MTATYSFDVFCTLDGFGSYGLDGDWGGYWGKHGPEFLDRRLTVVSEEQRMGLGANTFRQFVQLLGPIEESELDPVNSRMRSLPTTVGSTTLEGLLDWPDATVVSGDAVDVVARLTKESEVPLRSFGQPVDEPSVDGRRSGRLPPGDCLPRDHRSDRSGADLRGCGRLRSRADREPDARRPHPGSCLPAHPA